MKKFRLASTIVGASCLLASAGFAEDNTGYFLQPGIHSDHYELRLGVLAYDRGPFTTDQFSGIVVNGEFLFKSPEFLSAIGSPRPYIGTDIAIADDAFHFAYAGLNWDFRLTDRFYLSTSLGGAVTTADNLKDPTGYKALGCRALFHLGAALGYDVNDRWTVQAYADHFSNGQLCEPNAGAEAAGVRIGYRF
ncbi:acyloxyacyl hydrolase [Chelativorans sp. YIM 93263]|uniref:acyloxyacyl hydrolase n=1 Tax=Chelativorans sp. YIM 93263 TaxID=2906648 RepID=UPI002379AA00|nr:acyloxyacyl hydrolase [Chelativorans sp. YIM 93263]